MAKAAKKKPTKAKNSPCEIAKRRKKALAGITEIGRNAYLVELFCKLTLAFMNVQRIDRIAIDSQGDVHDCEFIFRKRPPNPK